MIDTTDRFVVYLPIKKKRQLTAILAGKGVKIQSFFNDIIDQVITDEKSVVLDLFKKTKNEKEN